jgi:hypothetical protein
MICEPDTGDEIEGTIKNQALSDIACELLVTIDPRVAFESTSNAAR